MLVGFIAALAVARAADESAALPVDPEPVGPVELVPPLEPPAPPVEPPPLSPDERLARAIGFYLDGSPSDARVELQQLLALGPALPGPVRQSALAYLGDILLSEQGIEAARNPFETLLAEAPGYAMDPFKHPPEVVAAFEAMRRSLPGPDPVPAVRPDAGPWPWLIVLPGGAHYFRERRPVPGILVAATQAAGLGVSLWSRSELERLRYAPRDGGVEPNEDDGEFSGPFRVWKVVNVLSVAAGWTGYAVPIVVETARWGTPGAPIVEVGPTRLGVRVPF